MAPPPGEILAEIVTVEFEILNAERLSGAGRVLAVASVRLDIAGVEIELHGLTVRRQDGGGYGMHLPAWRHPTTGKWLAAAVLPSELATAIGEAVFAVLEQEGAGLTDPGEGQLTAKSE